MSHSAPRLRLPGDTLANYAFGVLEGLVGIDAAAVGLDLAVGFLHASRPGRRALVYDLMEPLRPVADQSVLRFVRSRHFEPGDFHVTDRGVCRLNSEMARVLAAKVGGSDGADGLR